MRIVLPFLAITAVAGMLVAAALAPPAVKEPGTQPDDNVTEFDHPENCLACHLVTADPVTEPILSWRGGMMAHAMRDPIYWATLAVAEQDFLPGLDPALRGGAGDLCLRCHGPNGWLQGRSEPTDGSAYTSSDVDGVECEFCHMLVNPDEPVNIAGTTEIHQSPFEPYDDTTGDGYHGAGEYVLNDDTNVRLGPYSDANPASHTFLPSPFHRQGEFCGTCHDVSNPVVGDLAHNNGAQVPLDPGTFSGDPASDLADKAAFNNFPYAYGVVERTFSEWKSGALDTTRVNDFATLPADLQVAGGALALTYQASVGDNPNADYADGTPRYYTCQSCHLPATSGKGCGLGSAPERTDVPFHDLTGGGVWQPELIQYEDTRGTLRFGTGLTVDHIAAMAAAQARAAARLQSAAGLEATYANGELTTTVTNLTGHKLISGYPEGRRMWLTLEWVDRDGLTVRTDGAYGAIGRTARDLDGVDHDVLSLIDPDTTVTFNVHGGMDQEWAAQLIGFGYPSDFPLTFDRMTDAVTMTLGQLAASTPGTEVRTFHFVLNNVVLEDTRIPPYGFEYDEALRRSILPVPATQYGDPGPGGTYDHFAVHTFSAPPGAVEATVTLYYQATSWEYIQFLDLANDTLSPFLGDEGTNLVDGWLNAGDPDQHQAAPIAMASTTVDVSGLFADGFESGNTTAWDATQP